jgi:hypothetical protein
VPELAYYDAQTTDPAHMKGVLYFDNASVVLKMHKDHGQLHLRILTGLYPSIPSVGVVS